MDIGLSMSTLLLEDARWYLDTLYDFIDYDIKEVAIPGKANYLAALGLSAYTEILGGLYNGNLSSNLGIHYIKFIETLSHILWKD
jgi:hypothetical protein